MDIDYKLLQEKINGMIANEEVGTYSVLLPKSDTNIISYMEETFKERER